MLGSAGKAPLHGGWEHRLRWSQGGTPDWVQTARDSPARARSPWVPPPRAADPTNLGALPAPGPP